MARSETRRCCNLVMHICAAERAVYNTRWNGSGAAEAVAAEVAAVAAEAADVAATGGGL
jgi:hypothetical protein